MTNLLRSNLQFFAEGGDDPTDVPKDTPETPDIPSKPPEPKTVTMTQDELDALIGREKGRVKGKYADYDELKAKLAEHEEAKQSAEREKLSEIERLQADLEAKDAAERELSEQLTQYKAQAKADKLKQEFTKAAQDNGITYVDAAFKLADLSAIEEDEAGNHVGVKELVEALAAANPFLAEKKQQREIGDPSNGGRGVADEKTKEQLLNDAAAKAKATGLPKDRAEYAKLKRELN